MSVLTTTATVLETTYRENGIDHELTIVLPPRGATGWKCPECEWLYISPIPLTAIAHLCETTSRLHAVALRRLSK